MLRFYVDYSSYDKDEEGRERVYLDIESKNSPELFKQLQTGLYITVCDCETLEFEATVGFHERYQVWYGILDLSSRRDLPPISNCE